MEKFGCRFRFGIGFRLTLRFSQFFCSAFGFVSAFGSLFGIVTTLLLATSSFSVSDFESFPSSSRSSMLFSPAVDYALDLPAVGCALSVLLIFPCCWVCSSRGPRIRVASFLLLTTGSLAEVPSLLPPPSLFGSLRLRGSLPASSNTTSFFSLSLSLALSLVLQGTSEPSCAPLISSSSVVCSRSVTLDLATALLLRWNRASTCSGPYCGSHLASSRSSAPVFAPVHPSWCSDVWRYSGIVSLLARQRTCTAAVKLQ